MKIFYTFVLLMSAASACQDIVSPDCSLITDAVTYHPHESSCSLYYRCEDGVINTFKCIDGSFFNVKSSVCELASNVICDRCKTPQEDLSIFIEAIRNEKAVCPPAEDCKTAEWGTLKPYPVDCTKYIYCDMFNNAEMRSCPAGQEFDPTLKKCLPAAEANCPICSELTTTEAPTTLQPTTSTPEVCKAIETCLPNEVGFVKPYGPDCTKYIYCGVGDEQIRSCPVDPMRQRFSPTLLVCVNPGEVDCKECILDDTTTLDPCTMPTCSISEWGVQKPHPSDCSRYIYCDHLGNATIRTCPEGEEFNSLLARCVSASLAECLPCDYSTTTVVPTLQPCPMPTCEPEEWGVTKPHPVECGKYIYCDILGEEVIRHCQSGFEYSPTEIRCVPAIESDCTQCFITTTEQTTTPILTTVPDLCPLPSCSPSEWGVTKPNPNDCSSYVYCNELGNATIRVCPNGLYFSPTLHSCVEPELAGCVLCGVTTTEAPITSTTVITTPDPCPLPTCGATEWGLLKPHPNDCNLYVYCGFLGTSEIRQCQPGLEFDPVTARCVDPSESNCLLCGETTEPPTTTTIITTPDPCPIPTCTLEEVGMNKPHPDSCEKYIYCNENGTGEISHCLLGLHFSVTYQSCKEPLIANCVLCGFTTTTTTTPKPTSTTTTTLKPTSTTTTTLKPTSTTTTTLRPTSTTTTTLRPTSTTTTTLKPTSTTTTTLKPTSTTTTTLKPTSTTTTTLRPTSTTTTTLPPTTTTTTTLKPTYPALPDPYINKIRINN